MPPGPEVHLIRTSEDNKDADMMVEKSSTAMTTVNGDAENDDLAPFTPRESVETLRLTSTGSTDTSSTVDISTVDSYRIDSEPTNVTSSLLGTSTLPWEMEDWDFEYEIGGAVVHDSDSESDGEDRIPPANALFIVNAAVTGFVGEKPGATDCDIAYVVNVNWSDGRTHVVKRTFADFLSLHYCLVEDYAQSSKEFSSDDSPLTLGLYLPERQNAAQDSIMLAEYRELQLHKYVKELVKLPKQISGTPTVLTFFESRNSDPKPYKDPSTNVAEKNDPEHFTLCWV